MKKNSPKRVLVSTVLSVMLIAAGLLAAVPAAQVHAASNFIIESMDVQMQVNEDDTYDITETLHVHFTAPSHGIYRSIPTYVTLDRDGQVSTFYAKVRDFTMVSGQEYKKESDGSDFRVRIGDPDKYENTDAVYTYKYRYDMRGDHLDGADEVYHNLVGTDWEAKAIEEVSFTVTFPKDIDMANVGMKTGDQEDVAFETEGNRVVRGVTTQDTLRGLTIRAVLPEGYFTKQAGGSNALFYVLIGLLVQLAAAGFFLWRKHGRDPVIVETEEFYPPKGLSAPEVGYLDEGEISGDHVVSMLLSLADKGYLRIREKEVAYGRKKKKTKTEYEIEQVREYDGKVIGESTFMNGLFEDGERPVVELSELTDKFYKTVDKIKKAITEHYEGKLYDEKAGNYALILYGAGTLSLIALVFLSKLLNGSPFIMDGDIMMSLMIMAFELGLPLLAFFMISNRVKEGKRGIFGYIGWGILAAAGVGLMRLFDTFAGAQTIPYLIGLGMCLVLFLLGGLCERKTDLYADLLGKIRGYKRFLQLAEKDRMEMLAEQDPEYYYKNLAYAFALGVTSVYASRFAALAVKPPEWYVSGTSMHSGSFDAGSFAGSLDSMMSSVSTSMTSSPSGGSGGGSFSGGGGGGGGGGGSW